MRMSEVDTKITDNFKAKDKVNHVSIDSANH